MWKDVETRWYHGVIPGGEYLVLDASRLGHFFKDLQGGSKKSKLLILSECVNKTEKIGGM